MQDHLVFLEEQDEIIFVTDGVPLSHELIMITVQVNLWAFGWVLHHLTLFLLKVDQHVLGSFESVLVGCTSNSFSEIHVVD